MNTIRLDRDAHELLGKSEGTCTPLELTHYKRVIDEVKKADVVIDYDDKVVKNRFGPEGGGATMPQIEGATLVRGVG